MSDPPDPLLLPPDAVSVPPKALQSPVPDEVYEAAVDAFNSAPCTHGCSDCEVCGTLAAADTIWPLAVEAVEQQIIVRQLEKQRQREAGIPEGLPPGEVVDALLADWRARNAAVRARQRDAIKAEGLRKFVTRLDALYEQEKAARPTWDSQAMAFLAGLERASYEADCMVVDLDPPQAPDMTEENR